MAITNKEIEEAEQKKREFDTKLRMHEASMGGGNVRSPKKVSNLLKDFYKLDGENVSPKEVKKQIEQEPTETIYELTQKALDMADKIMASKGVKNMVSNPIMSSAFNPNSKRQSENQQSQSSTPSATEEQPSATKEPKEKKDKAKSKKDPARSKVGPGVVKNLKKGDSDADVVAKTYNFMLSNYHEQTKENKDITKYRKKLDKVKTKRVNELIDLFGGTKYKSKKKINSKSSFGIIGALLAVAGVALYTKNAFAKVNDFLFTDDIKKILGSEGSSDIDFEIKKSFTESDAGARESAEDYLGRKMSDDEFDDLIKTTHAEAGPKSNKKEQAGIMATILNRARDDKETISTTINKPGQFQSVTGTANNPGPSQQFLEGPSEERRNDIVSAASTILPNVSRSQKHFSADSDAAYKPGTSTAGRDRLRAGGGTLEGGTRFETSSIPDPIIPTASKVSGVTTSGLVSPVDNVKSNSEVGMRRGKMHEGIDYPVPANTPVKAAHSGTLKSAGGPNSSAGYYATITGPDGTETKYMHLSRPPVVPDGPVTQGQVIGLSGNTGHVEGANGGYHLHFEARDPTGQLISSPALVAKNVDIPQLNNKKGFLSNPFSNVITNNTTNVIQGNKTVATTTIPKSNQPALMDQQY